MQHAADLLAGLARDVGAANLSTAPPDRIAYSRDLWPRSQLDRLAGDPPVRPSCVVWPGSPEEIAAVVRRCASAGVPIVPFGAGSGVCGGTRPDGGGVVVDVKRLKRVRRLDVEAGEVEVEAGLMGENFERRLERAGVTLGHFPSSILCSTVGGWVAGRSAGQCSSRYGKIEDMVIDLEVVTGDGVLRRTPRADAIGPGPDWNQLFVGSEGTLGVITAATLRVHPQPVHRAFGGWLMPDYRAGLAVMRGSMQAGDRPAVIRLYDALDTFMVGANPNRAEGGGPLARLKDLLGTGGGHGGPQSRLKQALLRTVLGAPGLANRAVRTLPQRCLMIGVCEGQTGEAEAAHARLGSLARAAGGQDLGETPGRNWLAHRHDVSYKQSRIYEAGCFVDTCEVATTWARLPALYEAVRRAVGPFVLVMAHFSHAYPGGCSIYFTFAGSGRDVDAMRRRYDAAWRAGLDAAAAHGAAIAHHHGVGLSRRWHMAEAHGEARQWFDALKRTLDPAGVMNPGKVFAEEGAS